MTITVVLWSVLLLAVLCGWFFAGAETGIYSLNRVRLRVAAEHNRPGARRLAALMQRPEDLVITTLLGTNLADYIVIACISALLLRAAVAEHLVELYATLIATPLVLVFCGILPKDWFRREADRLMYAFAAPLAVCLWLARTSGLAWLLRSIAHKLSQRVAARGVMEEELLPRAQTLRLLREGAAWGELTLLQRDLMERVMNISKTAVAAVMIPRERAALVPLHTARDDFLRISRMCHFSRLPVYARDPRRIVGIIYVYDVLTDAQPRPPREYVRPALRLPANLPVSAALLRMQQARQTMAIVEDPGGHCLGILTIKDLAEEIIGDVEAW